MVIKGHLFSRSTLGAKQSASLKRNFSDGNPMRGGSRLISIYCVFHSAKPYLQCSGGCVFLLDSNNCHGVHLHQVLFTFCVCTCAIAFYVVNVFMCAFPARVYMEAVKLESMHAPEHVMSSLVVAQVLIQYV